MIDKDVLFKNCSNGIYIDGKVNGSNSGIYINGDVGDTDNSKYGIY